MWPRGEVVMWYEGSKEEGGVDVRRVATRLPIKLMLDLS
jgi:hypothetical protein